MHIPGMYIFWARCIAVADVPGVAGSEPPAEELAPLKVDLTEILKSQWPSSLTIFSKCNADL